MPGIPQTLADELLPLIFRRRRQPMLGNDLPEQGGYGGNMLGPPPQDPSPAPPVVIPASANPSEITTQEEVRPRRAAAPNLMLRENLTERPNPVPSLREDLTATPVMQPDPGATRMARRVKTDRRGRPTPNIALQGDEQTLDYQDRLARMPEDTEGGGWWPKIRAAIAGFAAGGPVGAASAFGTRALREHFDPTLGSREYKREKMAQNASAVEQIRQGRKDRLDEEAKRTNIGLAKARTDELKNRKATEKWVIKQDEQGVFRPVNQATGLDPDGKPVKGPLASPSEWEIKVDDRGQFVPVNKRTGLDQNGKTVKARPLTGKDVGDVQFDNQQIQRAISDAEAEQKKIDDAMKGIPSTIESENIFTQEKKMVPNPEYTYNMTRRRQLDDDIRNWRLKLKSGRKASAQTEDPDIRAYADQYFGGDYAAAEAAAVKP